MKTSAPTTRVAPAHTGHHSGWASLWWFAGILLIGIPIVYWATANAEPEELADRREQIQNMSPAERERLNRNFERFQKLPPEKQEALREIDEQVNSDTKLKSTLLAYDRWLHTLTPWQRQELNTADTPEAKIEVVASINADRKAQHEEYERQQQDFLELVEKYLPSNQGFTSSSKGPGRKPMGFRLTSDELNEMMAVLEAKYASQVKLNKNSLPGNAARNLQLLALALQDNIETRGKESARETPLPQETVQSMIDRITESEARAQVQKIYEGRDPDDDPNARGFVGYLAWKLKMAWIYEAREHYSRAELDDLSKTLGGNVLSEFESRKRKDPNHAYMFLLMVVRPAAYHQDTEQLNDVMKDLDLWRAPNSGRPGGGRFGNGDRDRGGRGPSSRDGRGFPKPPQRPNPRTGQEPDPAIAEKPVN